MTALDSFLNLLEQQGKRCVLLLDNINDIFAAITDESELHHLRAFLMEDPRVMIIGASASYFK